MTEEEKEYNPSEDDMGTVKVKKQKVQFYPEDLAKLETMSQDEQIDFAIKLRQEGRYIIINED